MRSIPAFRGEFGLRVHYHVPQVHTLCLAGPGSVEIEEGMEALYPAAAEWRVVDGPTDHAKRGSMGRPPDLGVESTRFVPEPHVRSGFDPPDVVICPRWMAYGESKNWDRWQSLADQLLIYGGRSVFAAGARESSVDIRCTRAAAWDGHRPLDASIEAMRAAKLVIATDAGLAHLAVLCGAPLLLVTYRGLVAPGPVIDSAGRTARRSYWPAGESPNGGPCRFEAANHTGVPIRKVDGWEDVGRVVDAALEMMA